MKTIFILLACVTMTGCAHSDPWTRQDTVLQLGVTAVLAMDAITTADIQNHDNIVEIGPVARPLLGPNPSTADTAMYFTTVAISHWLISRALPKKWRPWWQGASIAYEARWVINNCELDLAGC